MLFKRTMWLLSSFSKIKERTIVITHDLSNFEIECFLSKTGTSEKLFHKQKI